MFQFSLYYIVLTTLSVNGKYKTQGVRKLVRCLSGNIGQTFLMSKLCSWLILSQKDAVIYAEITSAIIIAIIITKTMLFLRFKKRES